MKRRADRGNALLLVTVLLIVFVGLAAAYMTVTSGAHSAAKNALRDETAFVAAESGIDDAINELNARLDYGEDGLGCVRGLLGRAEYEVSIDPPFRDLQRYVLRSVGACDDSVRVIVAVVEPEGMSAARFASALFGDRLVNLGVNAAVDSFNSRDGDYEIAAKRRLRNQEFANAKGNVKSNGRVRLSANAKVFGDLTSGPAADAQLVANAHVEGASTQSLEPESLAAVDVPELPSEGGRTVASKREWTLLSGSYRYDEVILEAGATLRLVGPATLVADRFVAGPGARIEIDAKDGPVTLYGTGAFQLDPSIEWKSVTRKSSDFALRIATDPADAPDRVVQVGGSGKFYGTIYAPHVDLVLASGLEVFGAIAARSIDVGSGAQIHYDEALAPAAGPRFKLVSWEEARVKVKKPPGGGKSGKSP